MKFLLTLVACCGTNVSSEDEAKNLDVGVVREKKLTRSGKICGKNGRQPIHWRPSLCTISEEDVIMAERIQLYVKPSNNDRKNVTMPATNNKPFVYKNEFKNRPTKWVISLILEKLIVLAYNFPKWVISLY
ncbi:hypothetical protein CTI12_AA206990 [Artemisia annua]|uniref:Uncharacterized protein n=1 Tax=Artemisia annua TaxID=35608 RepID=A0A2U1P0J0_ARTAN|nr:hypothetical protein CTI12_AA206990 [Artemisia annua]